MASTQSIPVSALPLVQFATASRLPRENRERWTRAASALLYPDYRDLDAWLEFCRHSAHLARRYLSPPLAEALTDFFTPFGPASLVIDNLPIDPKLPSIPLDGLRPVSKQAVSEAVIAGILTAWGEILSFVNEKSGAPIHEVTPVPGLETSQSNAGRVRFGFHSDNAFLPGRFRQRGILLYGLCNQDTATLILTAEQILALAPHDLARSLAKPIFRHACPASFFLPGMDANGTPPASPPCPILWRDESGLARVSAASSSIEPLTVDAEKALQRFRALMASIEPTRVVVRPGTALLFKNDRVLHGRDAVNGLRWLQRAYFTDSLAPLREATRSDPRAFAFDARALLCA